MKLSVPVLKIQGAVVFPDMKISDDCIKFGEINNDYKYFTYTYEGGRRLSLVSKDCKNWVLPISVEVNADKLAEIMSTFEKEGE